MKHITVIGSGITGLASAYLLSQSGQYRVTLLEANDYFGGHSNAVDVKLDGASYPVDTGFLVFNHKTYPNLTALFDHLQIETPDSDMSFGLSIATKTGDIEWAGDDLSTVFAQKKNVFKLPFLHMLADILRFGHFADDYLRESEQDDLTLGALLDRHRYSQAFQRYYLLPMGAAIWSTAVADIRDFPAASFIRFCQNHVLLTVRGRPQWKTVGGSSRQYVQAIIAHLDDVRLSHRVTGLTRHRDHLRLEIATPSGHVTHQTDLVVFACHTDQTLNILDQAALPAERQVLQAIRYAPNEAFLHTDISQMPKDRKVWSSWNYVSSLEQHDEQPVAVTYWLNRLQPLPFRTPLMVTLNPIKPIDPRKILARFEYEHPQMDHDALRAQQKLADIQGLDRCYFAGAWAGYGFHEDGLKAALRVVKALSAPIPWTAVLS
mgnify:FL=1